jgi:hypothetical protein
MARSDDYGALFGSVVGFAFALSALGVVILLVTRGSSDMLTHFRSQIDAIYRDPLSEPPAGPNTTALEDASRTTTLQCDTLTTTLGSQFAALAARTQTALSDSLTDTIDYCTNRITALQTTIASIVAVAPNVTQLVSGTVEITSQGGIAPTSANYGIYSAPVRDLTIQYIVIEPWDAVIDIDTSFIVNPTITYAFTPPLTTLTNSTYCPTGQKPLLTVQSNKFSWAVASYHFACDGSIVFTSEMTTTAGDYFNQTQSLMIVERFF